MFYRFGVERVQRCWKTLCQHDVCVTIIVSQLHTPCWPAYSKVKTRENEEVQVKVEKEKPQIRDTFLADTTKQLRWFTWPPAPPPAPSLPFPKSVERIKRIILYTLHFAYESNEWTFAKPSKRKVGTEKTAEKIRENLHLHNIFLFTCVCVYVWVCFNAELGTTTSSGAAFVWQTVRFISLMQHYMLHVAHVVCVHLNMHYMFQACTTYHKRVLWVCTTVNRKQLWDQI